MRESLQKATSLDERLTIVSEAILSNSGHNYQLEEIKTAAISYYNKLLAADAYTPGCKLEQRILLLKADQSATSSLADDYGLSDVCNDVTAQSFNGNHVNFITDHNSKKVADALMEWFECY